MGNCETTINCVNKDYEIKSISTLNSKIKNYTNEMENN
jgi:hypothetical protein